MEASHSTKDPNRVAQPPATSNFQFKIVTLILITTFVAVLAGWWIDHRRLAAQIPQPGEKTVVIYRLTHASARLAHRALLTYFVDDQCQTTIDEASNSIIVSAPPKRHEQIQFVLNQINRVGTEYSIFKPGPSVAVEQAGASRESSEK